MVITDKYIINKFFSKTGRLNGNYSTKEYLSFHCPEVLSYLEGRYDDSESLRETFLRIYYNIERRPKCPFCTSPVKWRGKKYCKLFADTCGKTTCWLSFREQTMINRYGVSHLGCTKETVEKIKKTKLERYGDAWYANKEKRFKTNLKKYGTIVPVNEDIIEKRKKTCLERFGVPVPSQSEIVKEKYRNTCLKKYGVDNFRKSEECTKKIIESRREHGTITSSSYEKNAYIWLIEAFGEHDVIQQYKDYRYKNPKNGHLYHCDFYIKSLDLFIELQMYWAHGDHPFDSTSLKDLEYLNIIKTKAKEKPIYNRYIENWSDIDVVKRTVALENKLRYLEIFDRSLSKDKLLHSIKEYVHDNF